jgi:hypothetical protein
MPSGDTRYQARFETPEFLERGRNNPIECRVYSGSDTLVAPTSGTVSVYDSAGTAVVDAAAVTVASSKATYTVLSTALTDRALEAGWRVEWTLLISSVTHVFRQSAILCRRILYNPVTEADLLRRHQDLDSLRESARSSYQDEIDEAWAETQNAIVARGNRPNLITDPSSLRAFVLHKTLGLVYENFWHGTQQDAYRLLFERHYEAAKTEWDAVAWQYDRDEDGVGDTGGTARAGRPVLTLSSPKSRWGVM